MVALDDASVARGLLSLGLGARSAAAAGGSTVWFRSGRDVEASVGLLVRGRRRRRRVHQLRVTWRRLLLLPTASAHRRRRVDDHPARSPGLLVDLLVVVVGIGVFRDDVPRMQKSRDLRDRRGLATGEWGRTESRSETYEAQHAQRDVDDRVAGTDSTLYPNYNEAVRAEVFFFFFFEKPRDRRFLTRKRWEQDGEDDQEAVRRTHRFEVDYW